MPAHRARASRVCFASCLGARIEAARYAAFTPLLHKRRCRLLRHGSREACQTVRCSSMLGLMSSSMLGRVLACCRAMLRIVGRGARQQDVGER